MSRPWVGLWRALAPSVLVEGAHFLGVPAGGPIVLVASRSVVVDLLVACGAPEAARELGTFEGRFAGAVFGADHQLTLFFEAA